MAESEHHRDRRQGRKPSPALPTLAARVRQLAPGTSWEQARALCRSGQVLVDGRPALDPASRPAMTCRVELAGSAAGARAAEGVAQAAAASAAPIASASAAGSASPRSAAAVTARPAAAGAVRLVHCDADLVVVDKPASILTVPFARGDRDTLLALARVALRRREAAASRPARGTVRQPAPPAPAGERPRAPHPTLRAVQRLDRDTSGLVVFARTVAAQRELQRQLAAHTVTRRYQALVHGAAHDALFDTWLVRDRGDGLRGSWAAAAAGEERGAPPAGARRAVTRVRVLERLRGATHLACELSTGRQHQIRIHLAEAGHPLLGETVYIRDFRGPRIAAPRPMLHAATLGFRHPRDGRPVLCEQPPPADFTALLARLRLPGRSRDGS